jgi:hypothetical protein
MTTATAPAAARMVRSIPAATHLRALRAAGCTDRAIIVGARLTHPQQLRRAYRGEPIGWDVERRILTVAIPNEAALYVPVWNVGTRRRIRALHALGWPLEDLATALGWPMHKIGSILADYPVPAIDHLAVCALYDQRWMWTPEEHGVAADVAEQARLVAQVGQCASPLAWDDHAIDDPNGRPRTGPTKGGYGAPDHAAMIRTLDGDAVAMSGRTRTLAIEYAARYLDMPWDVMAERLGMEEASLRRTWERIKVRVRAENPGTPTWVDEPRFADPDYIAAANRQMRAVA